MSLKQRIKNAVNSLRPKQRVVFVERVRSVPVVVGKRVLVRKKATPRLRAVSVRRQVRVTIRRTVSG